MAKTKEKEKSAYNFDYRIIDQDGKVEIVKIEVTSDNEETGLEESLNKLKKDYPQSRLIEFTGTFNKINRENLKNEN